MFWTVRGPQSISQVENRFKISTKVIHTKFNEVLNFLNAMAIDIIQPNYPEFKVVHERLQDARFAPHFDGCIVQLMGHIFHAIAPSYENEIVNHVDGHGYPTQKYHGSVRL